MIVSLAALLITSSLGQSTGRPPTIDPTYGFPVPKITTKDEKRPPQTTDWIWTEKVADNQTIYLRGAVSLKSVPAHASLYVTADNYFHAYVNGHEVGARVASDGVDNWQEVQHYDVGAWLVAGKNVIAIEGGNAGGQAGVLARLEIGGKPVLETNSKWKAAYEAPQGWVATSFDDSDWKAATSEGHADVNPWGGQLHNWPGLATYQPSYLKHLMVGPVGSETIGGVSTILGKGKPVTIAVKGTGEVTLDFGQELTGRVEVKSSTGLKVTVGTGESKDEAQNQPYKTAKMDLEPGRADFSPYTAYRFARLQFDNVPAGGAVVTVSCDHLYYPVAYRGSFDCSEPLLTKVWYTGAYTAHLCMQEDIWDAPKRDRLRWMGDLHVSGEVINNVFFDKFLMEQTMERLRMDAQGGKPIDEMPRSHVNGIPGYTCAWIAGLADFQRHMGDTEYLKSQAPYLTTMIKYMKTELDDRGVFVNKNGQWPYTDWAPEFDGDHPLSRIATHLFYAYAASEAAFIYKELGDTENEAKCEAWHKQLAQTAQKYLLDSNGIFGDRRQANAMAIFSGVATAAQREKIQSDILAPNAPAWGYTASPYYNNYVLLAMKGGVEPLEIIRRYWEQMILEGATTFYEGYEPTWEKAHFHQHLQADDGTGYFVSLCHGWSAGPTNFLTERVLGVRPTSGGFKTFTLTPDLGDLKWAKGTVPTPHGDVSVFVQRRNSEVTLKVTVPAGSVGTLTLKGSVTPKKGNPVAIGDGQWTLAPGEYELVSKE